MKTIENGRYESPDGKYVITFDNMKHNGIIIRRKTLNSEILNNYQHGSEWNWDQLRMSELGFLYLSNSQTNVRTIID